MRTQKSQGMKTFIIIWLGQLTSMIGSGMIGFALGVWIYDQTGQATPFALTALFSAVPRLLLSPLAGALADRWNRKKIMLISDSLSGLVTLGTAILLLTGNMQIWMVYLLSFFDSVFASFQQPAYSASIVMLVPKDQLTRANSMVQLGQAIESILTPVLAGALFSLIGMGGILLIDLITYLFAVVVLIMVYIPQPEQVSAKSQEKVSVFKDVAVGWRYLSDRKGLLGLLIYFAGVNFLANISAVMVGPLVLSFSSPASMGFTQTMMGLGMLGGSLIMSMWGGPKKNRIRTVIGSIALAATGFIITGLHPSLVFVSAGLFVLLFFIPFGSGTSSGIFAEKVPPDLQGRVLATRSMISQSMMPLAFILSGVFADHVFTPLLLEGGALAGTFVGDVLGVGPGRGIGLMLICSGILLMLISGLAYAYPRIRRIEIEVPDAIPNQAAAVVDASPDKA
mgnify:CR=1 FL=1